MKQNGVACQPGPAPLLFIFRFECLISDPKSYRDFRESGARPKCNKRPEIQNVITFCPKCNKLLRLITLGLFVKTVEKCFKVFLKRRPKNEDLRPKTPWVFALVHGVFVLVHGVFVLVHRVFVLVQRVFVLVQRSWFYSFQFAGVRFFPQHQIFQQKRLYSSCQAFIIFSCNLIFFSGETIACCTYQNTCCFTNFSSISAARSAGSFSEQRLVIEPNLPVSARCLDAELFMSRT